MTTGSIAAIAGFLVAIEVIGLANTVGFHRLLTHKSFVTKPWLRNLLALLSSLFSGSPMLWVGVHRVHHTISDAPGDPHTPKQGFWFAHCGWLIGSKNVPLCMLFALSGFGLQIRFAYYDALRVLGKNPPVWRKMTRDLEREPFMRFLDVPFVVTGLFVAQLAIAWMVGRWWGIAWLWAMQLILNNGSWSVNSICHLPSVGRAPHESRDQSRNVAWMTVITNGESNHNGHHRYPTSACHGLDGERDPSWAVIRGLARLGLAWNVQIPKPYAGRLGAGLPPGSVPAAEVEGARAVTAAGGAR